MPTLAADGAAPLSVTFAPGDHFSLVFHAATKIAAAVTSPDPRTIVITVTGATLPSGFPNYQSVPDALVAALSAAQTSLQPPATTIALTTRANATAVSSTSADGTTITILVAPAAGATPSAVSASVPANATTRSSQRAPLASTAPAIRPVARSATSRSGAFSQVYKLHSVTASNAARVLRTAFPSAEIVDDAATNSIVVRAGAGTLPAIEQALSVIDAAPQTGGSAGGVVTEVVQVLNAIPGSGTAASTSTTDLATALTSIVGPSAPDLRVTVPANSTLLAITGSPETVRIALEVLKKIDVPIAQIVLDTAVYEVTETAARNLGIQLGTAVLSTVFSEVTPQQGSFATAAPFLGIQQLTRTPLSLQAQLNLLIQGGQGRVLADPRIATISGRTATIRAGDNIPYVQQGSGALGTVTSTVLTFSTGVTLDITPIANPDGRISVNIHPIINTETGVTSQQVPQISSREAQTTVNLRDGETVIIGGLIQESDLDANNKIPLFGDLPLVGGAFRNKNASRSRNELVILVTPHLVAPDGSLDRMRPVDIQANRLAPTPVPSTSGSPVASPSPTPHP